MRANAMLPLRAGLGLFALVLAVCTCSVRGEGHTGDMDSIGNGELTCSTYEQSLKSRQILPREIVLTVTQELSGISVSEFFTPYVESSFVEAAIVVLGDPVTSGDVEVICARSLETRMRGRKLTSTSTVEVTYLVDFIPSRDEGKSAEVYEELVNNVRFATTKGYFTPILHSKAKGDGDEADIERLLNVTVSEEVIALVLYTNTRGPNFHEGLTITVIFACSIIIGVLLFFRIMHVIDIRLARIKAEGNRPDHSHAHAFSTEGAVVRDAWEIKVKERKEIEDIANRTKLGSIDEGDEEQSVRLIAKTMAKDKEMPRSDGSGWIGRAVSRTKSIGAMLSRRDSIPKISDSKPPPSSGSGAKVADLAIMDLEDEEKRQGKNLEGGGNELDERIVEDREGRKDRDRGIGVMSRQSSIGMILKRSSLNNMEAMFKRKSQKNVD